MFFAVALFIASDPLVDALVDRSHKDTLGPGGMRFYALAFTAYALTNEGRLDDAERVIDAMKSPRFRAHFTGNKNGARQGESAVYAGHVLLATARAGDGGLPLALELAHSVRHGQLLASYVQHPRRLWPADNEVALAALRTFAAKHPEVNEVSVAADRLEATLDAIGELPFSELDPVTKKKARPRGCALGLSVMMRGLHDPEQAAAIYHHFRESYWQSLGWFAGFREWPEGVEGGADADSGPIVLGVGASASAFGLAAARQVRAEEDYRVLSRSATVGMALTLDEEQKESLLARAILRYIDSMPVL